MRNALTLKSGNITPCCSYASSSRAFKAITVYTLYGRARAGKSKNNLKQDLTISFGSSCLLIAPCVSPTTQ